MEGGILMAYTKIDADNIAEVGTQPVSRVWSKTEILQRKTASQAIVDKMDELLAELNK